MNSLTTVNISSTSMTDKPFSVYAQRNGAPILDVLMREFSDAKTVLEIGSGTGQHAVQFADALPQLRWQSSDLEENCAGISAWQRSAGLANLLEPLSLDVRSTVLPDAEYDAVFSANTAHIMSLECVVSMFALVGTVLKDEGKFCLYGPFRYDGRFNAASNAEFHRTLRSRDSSMGIRDLEVLDELGSSNRLTRRSLYAMPANNYIVVWQKERQ